MKSNINRLIIAILFSFIMGSTLSAQNIENVLSLNDAIKIGLQNNYGILIAQNEAEIDQINHGLGNAGFLPSINLSANREQVYEWDLENQNNSGETKTNEETAYLSADIDLGWTLFDGGKMFVTYKKLSELRDLGQMLAKIKVEDTIYDIIKVYYAIVREQKLLDVLNTSVEISAERRSIANSKRDLGSGTEFELLLAQADLNTDRGKVIRQEVVVNDAKLELINLMGIDVDSEFDVVKGIPLDDQLKLSSLRDELDTGNKQLLAEKNKTVISGLELKEFNRDRFPKLELNTGYTFDRKELNQTPTYWNRTEGYYIGLTAKLNLFNGFDTHRKVQIAKINQKNAHLKLDEEYKKLETELLSEFKNYTGVVKLVELEKENLDLAREALDIALEQFRLATITSIELRETQNILINTENRLIDAQFDAKVSETGLLRIIGSLTNKFEMLDE